MSDFNLSNNIIENINMGFGDGCSSCGKEFEYILLNDVKEFIRLLKEVLYDCEKEGVLDASNFSYEIDKLAGEKLK